MKCFEQWCVLQLLVGILSTIAYVVLMMIYNSTADVSVDVVMIIINAGMMLAGVFLLTWVLWFGVVEKNGCICCIACCCTGKIILLVTAICEGIYACFIAYGLVAAVQLGEAVTFIIAVCEAFHLVTQIYVTIEAAFVWQKIDAGALTKEVTVGAAVTVGKG
jgi:hypothetical protein